MGKTAEESRGNVPDQEPARPVNSFGKLEPLEHWRRVFIFVGLILGLFLSFMDTSIVATSIYTIALEFNSLSGSLWVVLAYTLAFISCVVIFARTSDFVGRRTAVLVAFTLFIAFSLACGFSQNISQLIIFRALQGVGGAGLYALPLILLVEAGTLDLKLLTSSLIGASISLAGAVGPGELRKHLIVGGLLTSHASWRWVFWINAPIGIIAVAFFVVGWPNNTTAYDNEPRLSFSHFDYVGALLQLAAPLLVVFGLQITGTGSYRWNSGGVIASLSIGCACWALLFSWEYLLSRVKWGSRVASIFPYNIWTNRVLVSGACVTMLTGFCFFLLVINLPLRFQIVNQKSPSEAGISMLPLLFASGLGSFTSSFFLRQRNYTFQCLVFASGLVLLGCGLMTTLSDQIAIEPKCYAYQVILALGVGMIMSATNLLTTLNAGSNNLAVAQGIVAQARMLGGSIGVAAANAIFKQVAQSSLQGVLSPHEINALQVSTSILDSLSPTELQSVRAAFSTAYDQSLKVCVYVQAFALLAVFCGAQKKPVELGG